MKVTKTYSSLTKAKYTFSRHEVVAALAEKFDIPYEDGRVQWDFDYDEEGESLDVEFHYEVTTPGKEVKP
jgi:hypothetical protein